MKNNFYSKMAIARGGHEHNLYNEGIRDQQSITSIIKDIDLSDAVMRKHRQKFTKLETSEYRIVL
jgi:hypothetical protein